MLKRLSIIVLFLTAATSLFAGDPSRRTIIVRDGKVLLDESGPAGKRAFIGVAMSELTPELREFFGAPKTAGVLVSSVSDSGPAAKAGVHVGEVITAVNGDPVTSFHAVVVSLKDKHAGDTVRLDIIRAKSHQTVVVTAEEREGRTISDWLDLKEMKRYLGANSGSEW